MINIPANYYWYSVYTILTAGVGPVSQESHLTTPFNVLYSAPHNIAVPGAEEDHALVARRIPSSTVGHPDGCFEYNDQLVGIVELKSFWNLTETSFNEVL